MPIVLLVLLLLAATAPAAGAAERWRWPVRGAVVTAFATGPDRFAPGQHRGIDIAARAGAPVRAACSGSVRFAGRVPGRGRAVTLRCGALAATHLELGRTAVRRGDRVAAGDAIGTVAASHVQLGARRVGRADGYVDPLTLLAADPVRPVGPAPPPQRPGPARPAAVPAAPRAPGPAPEPVAVPPAAWFGLAALGAATPAGALAGRRRRHAGRTRPAAPSPATPGR